MASIHHRGFILLIPLTSCFPLAVRASAVVVSIVFLRTLVVLNAATEAILEYKASASPDGAFTVESFGTAGRVVAVVRFSGANSISFWLSSAVGIDAFLGCYQGYHKTKLPYVSGFTNTYQTAFISVTRQTVKSAAAVATRIAVKIALEYCMLFEYSSLKRGIWRKLAVEYCVFETVSLN